MGSIVRRAAWVSRCAAAAVLTIAAITAGAPARAQSGSDTVTVYTALQKELLAPYEEAFRKAHPNIKIAWIREATGILQARILAERNNPRADVLFGIPVMNLIAMAKEGMIEPYAPKGYKELKPHFRDTAEPPLWTGMDMWLNVICFNTVEAKKRNLPRPTKWSDLADPAYRGQVTLPNPAASQTGYLNASVWIQSMGEDKAWAFMDAIDKNVALYTNSSSTPCKMAATGEYAVGGSTDITAPLLKTKGAPIDIIVPEDKSPWEMEASSLAKGARNPQAAKIFLDWTVTKAAQEQFNKFMGIVGYPGLNNVPENYPANGEAMMAKNDVSWSVDNRARILAEWSKRYEAKAEGKGK